MSKRRPSSKGGDENAKARREALRALIILAVATAFFAAAIINYVRVEG